MKFRSFSGLCILGSMAAMTTGCYQDKTNREKTYFEGMRDNKQIDTAPPPKTAASTASKPDESKPKLTPADLGIPSYPGATPRKNPDGSVRAPIEIAGSKSLELVTADAPEKVDAYYKTAFVGAERSQTSEAGKPVFRYLAIKGGKSLALEIRSEGNATVLMMGSVDTPALPKQQTPPVTPATPPGSTSLPGGFGSTLPPATGTGLPPVNGSTPPPR